MKILMVCLGNICRSPLAEGILRKKLNEAGLKHIEVDSAGTSGHHSGENPDPRSIRNAKKNGVDIADIVSRKFRADDFHRFDRIYVMDHSNYNNVLSLARNKEDQEKVELFLNVLHPGKNKAVPDPWYGGDEGFQEVFELVDKACDALVELLKKETSHD
jgi:protein-tyrosine phosphatase